jgi:peptidoglycan/LPS O-acetylase OafA/YrhL
LASNGPHLPALDGLRGVAAMWVFALHLFDEGSGHASPGYLGVDVFFVLSGFVLSHAYGRRLKDTGDYARFLRARLARIYPLHLLTLLVVGALVLLWPGFAASYGDVEERFGPAAFVAQLLLVQNWAYFLPTSFNTPAWSLSAEWAGYLVFPAFLLTAARGRHPFWLATGCMACLAALLLLWGVEEGGTGSPGMLRMAFGILAGCLVHRAYVAGYRLPPLPASLAILLLLALAHIPDASLIGLLGFPALVLLCARGDGPLAWVCGVRPVVWLGEISYSIYLWHWIVIQAAVRLPWPDATEPFQPLVIVAVVIGLSAASYAWVEKPVRARVMRGGQAAAATPAHGAPVEAELSRRLP